MMKHYLLSLIAFVFACSVAFNSYGQGSTTAALSGVVKDKNGEELPGATVLAVHTPTGSQYGTVTNVSGGFSLRNMQVGGPYTITVQYIGFQKQENSNVYLQLGQTLNLNFELAEEATELQTIVISANEGEVINSDRTGAETTVSKAQILELPTVGRDISDFVRLTPQAIVDNSSNSGPAISIAGQNNRYNAIFIDGAVNNDVFGLSAQGTNGGQTGVNPISLDAIEQLSVSVAPYDVTLGGFTGGGINAVTRSGTNKFEGSAYYYTRNENFVGKTPVDLVGNGERQKQPDFSANTYGVRLGGPIIKNKLFFFTNVELQRNETPQPFVSNSYLGASSDGDTTSNYQFDQAKFDQTVGQITDFLVTNFGYDPGSFDNNVNTLKSEKIIAKLNWNISQNHKLSLRHSYVKAETKNGFGSSPTFINFNNGAISFPSTTNSSALELTSNFGANASNKLIIGYTTVNDDRNVTGSPFPNVRVRDGNANFSFGSEAFSTANILEQTIFTITDNFTWYKNKHTITVGTHNEFYDFNNVFVPRNYGVYDYNSVSDFLNQRNPREFRRGFALRGGLGDDSQAAAAFSASQLGFYVQDEFQVNEKLKLSGGIRIDIPIINGKPPYAEDVFTTTLVEVGKVYDLKGAEPGQVPSAQVYFAPRFGFNYDVKGDKKTQIRGGIGIFTGRVPFVWAGGPFNNNGTNVGEIRLSGNAAVLPNGDPIPLRDVDNLITPQDLGIDPSKQVPSGALEIFTKDFRYPQVMRTSLAIDRKLPWGMIGTLEGIYTKKINDINHRNVNINPAQSFQLEGDADNRLVETGGRIDTRYTDIIVVENTNKGYAYNISAQLQKPFSNGLTASVSWTYGESFTINDGTSSQLTSNWGRIENSTSGLNNLALSRSDFDPGHRVNGFISYGKTYAKNVKTTVSLFGNIQSGRTFSYVIGNSSGVLDRGSANNALVYIPSSISDINLVDIVDRQGNVVTTAAEQWEKLNSFISSDSYLDSRRGEYAERNGSRSPVEFTADVKILQDFSIKTGKSTNTLQFSLDIFNFTNLLNKNWGKVRNTGGATSLYQLENRPTSASPTARYTYQGVADVTDFYNTQIRDSGINSARWQMQFGVRYIFN